MNEQQIFYILGSVFFGLFILIFLASLALLSYIRYAVRKIERISSEIGEEILDTIRKTKKYAEYIGEFTVPAMLAKIFRARARARKRRNDEEE